MSLMKNIQGTDLFVILYSYIIIIYTSTYICIIYIWLIDYKPEVYHLYNAIALMIFPVSCLQIIAAPVPLYAAHASTVHILRSTKS